MSAFAKIVKAVEGFGYPYEPDHYSGKGERYFTYNYVTDRGLLFGDDDAVENVASVQIHFFLPVEENFIKIKNQIRSELVNQGMTYPEITNIREGNVRHIIFECETEEE